jgi:hypothetical protein
MRLKDGGQEKEQEREGRPGAILEPFRIICAERVRFDPGKDYDSCRQNTKENSPEAEEEKQMQSGQPESMTEDRIIPRLQDKIQKNRQAGGGEEDDGVNLESASAFHRLTYS